MAYLEVSTFQNCVILDSNKTGKSFVEGLRMFQNCVILDSNKTDYNFKNGTS